jgi:hypothetical protein
VWTGSQWSERCLVMFFFFFIIILNENKNVKCKVIDVWINDLGTAYLDRLWDRLCLEFDHTVRVQIMPNQIMSSRNA